MVLRAQAYAVLIAMAVSKRSDLILIDLNLPQIVGWASTDRLRADPATRNIPMVALCAHAMAGDRDKALGTGCGDLNAQPIVFARLPAEIEQTLVPEVNNSARTL